MKSTERMATGYYGEEEACEYELKSFKHVGEFDNMIIWGHEAMAEADDVFVKGVSEWIRLANLVRNQYLICET